MTPPLTLIFLLFLLPLVHATCSGRQSYVFSLSLNFTRATEVTLPEKTRIPLFVAVAHRENFKLFRRTEKVTDDVAEVALHWTAAILKDRLGRLKDSGVVSDFTIDDGVDEDGVNRFALVADDEATMVSIMVPLVPSPAWFVGIDSHPLCRGDVFIPDEKNVQMPSFNSGLDRGTAWTSTSSPFEEGARQPVGDLTNVDNIFASLALEKGTLGVDWWKILLGVLVGVAVLVVFVLFILPRLRRKKRAEIPLTAPDGVQW